MTTTALPVGSLVRFREDTPQHAKNAGILYVVVESPTGDASSLDRTHGDDREYLWLVDSRDVCLAPSRRRRRTGYVTALESAVAEGHHFAETADDTPEVCTCGALFADGYHRQAVKVAHLAAFPA